MGVVERRGGVVWHDDCSTGVLPKGHKYMATGTRRPLPPSRTVVLKRDDVIKAAGGVKKLQKMGWDRAYSALSKANDRLMDAAFKKPNVHEVVGFDDRIGELAERCGC